jgi:hypothetical protein
LKGADGWVIAHAMAGSGIVVTEELTTGSASKIKVPIVAKNWAFLGAILPKC